MVAKYGVESVAGLPIGLKVVEFERGSGWVGMSFLNMLDLMLVWAIGSYSGMTDSVVTDL